MVKAALASKLKASSISATADEVFLATRAAVGYAFEIWRMNKEFEDGVSIVSDLERLLRADGREGERERPVRGGEFEASRVPV